MASIRSSKGSSKSFISTEDPDATVTKRKPTHYFGQRGIVYISHLPHGFYEKQLRSYLEQFGMITNLRVGRSKRTGASKGYAFVEFKYAEVAEIVCDTMNNYLMFNKLVKCEMVSRQRSSKACFRDKVDPNNPAAKRARRQARAEQNALRTEEQNNARLKKQLKSLKKKKDRLLNSGYRVDIDLKSLKQ